MYLDSGPMHLVITSSGEDSADDNSVNFVVVAKNDTHKTTFTFLGGKDEFLEFGRKLQDFPFASKKDIGFKTGYWQNSPGEFSITLHLLDLAGRINMRIYSNDYEGNEAQFSSVVEANALQRLATSLQTAQFANFTEHAWSSE